eukprot:GHVP01014006.1.p1 GENE.GHVP01014006.1~~GHVP01014006.1.p1  ORF type:complete len:349 (+),score=54.17 GHVP01014006.1:47-1093(+)
MERFRNPILPGLNQDEDSNSLYLEEHILRATFSSVREQENFMPKLSSKSHSSKSHSSKSKPFSRNSQIQKGSCSASPSVFGDGWKSEVKESVKSTCSFKISCPHSLVFISFKNQKETEICKITIPRQELDLKNLPQGKTIQIDFKGRKFDLNYKILEELINEVEELQPLLMFSGKTLTKFSYHVHNDKNGISCDYKNSPNLTDMLCREQLLPGKLVFVFPESFVDPEEANIISQAKDGGMMRTEDFQAIDKTLEPEEVSDLTSTSELLPMDVLSAGKVQFIKTTYELYVGGKAHEIIEFSEYAEIFVGNTEVIKCTLAQKYVFRKDATHPNVFYKVTDLEEKKKLKDF